MATRVCVAKVETIYGDVLVEAYSVLCERAWCCPLAAPTAIKMLFLCQPVVHKMVMEAFD